MKSAQTRRETVHQRRHYKILEGEGHDGHHHDAHQAQDGAGEKAFCSTCGAAYREGRWQWMAPEAGAAKTTCPACSRIHARRPEGYVSIGGPFLVQHHDDIVTLIRRVENREKTEHPLKRIMAFRVEDNKLLIETTDMHLARGIGDALEHAYKGELRLHYNEAEQLLRVHWTR